ncbi:hypothetical protein K1719_019650 [Acacia pycnantha]|nr:hypothetical protein K1719_019650 [Acacia pycnantha]
MLAKFFPKMLDTTLVFVISYSAPHSSLIIGFVMSWIQEQWFSICLDSLVEHRTYYRMQHEKENPTLKTTKKKKKTELEKSKDLMENKVRNNFLAILRTLKPELLQDDHKIPKDVTWPKVYVQTDTHSCGVHVLTCHPS